MMKRALIALLLALVATSAMAQSVAPAHRPEVVLHQGKKLARTLDALPRLAAPDESGKRINAALDADEARLRDSVRQCRSQPAQIPNEWTRGVSTVMKGPLYLAFIAEDDAQCGNTYPSDYVLALAYDLRTGSPLNWERLLPPELRENVALDTALDGSRVGTVRARKLTELYVAEGQRQNAWPEECDEVYEGDPIDFFLWPDAKGGGIGVAAYLPHVVTVCGAPVVIPTALLRPLGVDAALLDAIDAGHKAWK